MTGKLIPQDTSAGIKEKFPAFPPRDDMQNFFHLNRPGHPASLDLHFGISKLHRCHVRSSPVRWFPHQRQGHRILYLLVAFNADRAVAVEQMGYSVRDQGKPPDFVLEIASLSTGKKTTETSGLTTRLSEYRNTGVSTRPGASIMTLPWLETGW